MISMWRGKKVQEYRGKVLQRVNCGKTMPKLVVGQYVHVRNNGLIHKGDAQWSRPMKVGKVLNGAVQLEDGRVRNLRHLSLFKANCIPDGSNYENLDETNGYLWGDDSMLKSNGLCSSGMDENVSGCCGNATLPICKSQTERKLPRPFGEKMCGARAARLVDRMLINNIQSTLN
ncbi:hypothetical protein NDU88_003927 [Pleurodeles waltl]|uniref:Uncharacterized protein n=1 Tax=Pleurodeles waltl TaxID=8319 RepID=A0AAV7RGK7_PLEWA|nr:hypothetical protein NDU88_003927 [Pleurodeles waltl]